MIATLSLIACVRSNGQDVLLGTGLVGKADKSEGWQPGAVIPGWEAYDFDCELEVGGGASLVALPDLWYGRFGLYVMAGDNYMGWQFSQADCTDFACEGLTSLPLNAPSITGTIDDDKAADLWHKAGYYGGDTDRRSSSADAAFYLPTGGFTTTDDDGSHEVSACFSRVRPDELTGVVYVRYSSQNLYHAYYDHALVQYPFDIRFADHAGLDYNTALARESAAADDRTAPFFAYATDAGYDIAWDWDAITDPDIRAAVYDRYTPENWL